MSHRPGNSPFFLCDTRRKSRLFSCVSFPHYAALTFGLSCWSGKNGGFPMKKLTLAMAAAIALLSIAGCGTNVGKGKAPPPVVTKG
jgi:hypothetical protein